MTETNRPCFSMTRQADRYYLQCEGPGVAFTDRELTADDLELFTPWNRAYGRALQKIEPAPDLLTLGREIAQWLDRDYNWLLRLKEERLDSPFIVEFQVAQRDPDEEELRFLEVPWELAADKRGHLAADSRVMFCPVRRIGKISAPPPCSPYQGPGTGHCLAATRPEPNRPRHSGGPGQSRLAGFIV